MDLLRRAAGADDLGARERPPPLRAPASPPRPAARAAAPGTAANVALPPFAGDAAYRAAWDRVVAPVVSAFGPDAIVAQCGVDHHHADPLSHMLTTMPLYRVLWARLRALAGEVCAGRLVALGGEARCAAPPRAWAGPGGRAGRAGPSAATSPSPGAGSPSGRAVPSRLTGGGRTRGRRPIRSETGARPRGSEAAIAQSVAVLGRFGESARDRAPPRGGVALVAGATRGAGRGIAVGLGEAGAAVYCSGRSTRGRRSELDRPRRSRRPPSW